MQYNKIQCNAIEYNTNCIVLQYNTIQYNHNTILYNHDAVQYMQQNTTQKDFGQIANVKQKRPEEKHPSNP